MQHDLSWETKDSSSFLVLVITFSVFGVIGFEHPFLSLLISSRIHFLPVVPHLRQEEDLSVCLLVMGSREGWETRILFFLIGETSISGSHENCRRWVKSERQKKKNHLKFHLFSFLIVSLRKKTVLLLLIFFPLLILHLSCLSSPYTSLTKIRCKRQ